MRLYNSGEPINLLDVVISDISGGRKRDRLHNVQLPLALISLISARYWQRIINNLTIKE